MGLRRVIITLHILLSFFIGKSLTAPNEVNSLIASSNGHGYEAGKQDHTNVASVAPQIYQMHVKSDINNRFAHTTVISKVKNLADKAQEAAFSIILPEGAFISGFVMEIGGKNYTAYVKEKEEAQRTYQQAVSSGLGAAHVAVSARDSNRFTVSVNVEPATKAAFYLGYEELLKRQNGHYEQVINLHPGQPVKDLSVEVDIAESRKIIDLRAPPLRSGNEIGNEKSELDPRADIEILNETAAVVKFSPNLERQKQLAHLLGTKEEQGLAGQFVIQYDVQRDPQGGEVLIQDGYFVHFFAPSELAPLPKYVIFVLDTSSSMYGQKIEQLKQAMHKILQQLHEHDLFHLVEFNTNSKVWNLNSQSSGVGFDSSDELIIIDRNSHNEQRTYPKAYEANTDNINKAKNTVSAFQATASTDIHTALTLGLHLVEAAHAKGSTQQPMIIFLTDGDPTVGITSTEKIISDITEYNSHRTPIYALSFGRGADKNFLQKLALRNSGFSKHIYEASDASLQLEDFYSQISSPLLSNVTFKYQPSVTSLTKAEFPIHFGGSEIVVAGRYNTRDILPPDVSAWDGNRRIVLRPTVSQSVSSIERLWAYLTVKQLLEKKEVSDQGAQELKSKALDLSLQYSFVTPVSSLVVVKPNDTNAVDIEAADANQPGSGTQFYGSSRSGIRFGGPGRVSDVQYNRVPLPASIGFSGSSDYLPTNRNSGHHVHYRPTLDELEDRTLGHPVAHPFVPHSPATVQPQAFPIPPTTAQNDLDIFTALPWLRGILNQNGTLTLSSGTYKLGLQETIRDIVTCHNTPINSFGYCTLLSDCPSVHSTLTSVTVYERHFCTLRNEYAGVCCTRSPSRQVN